MSVEEFKNAFCVPSGTQDGATTGLAHKFRTYGAKIISNLMLPTLDPYGVVGLALVQGQQRIFSFFKASCNIQINLSPK